MALEFWDIAADRLRKSLGNNNYKSWIEPLQFVGESGGAAEFFVPTSFFGNYVRQHFEDQILFQMRESGIDVSRATFSVGRLDQKPAARLTTPAVVAAVKPRDIQGAKLDQRFVFENFVVGKPNELAHAAAKRVAEAGPVTFNPLFLYGGVGLGKTHLMHSIAWELQSNRPDINVMYLSAEQFMYRFVQALRERKMMDFKELFRSVDVLMVDDVQFIGGKDSTQEEFFHTFNALLDRNNQMILTCDKYPKEIDGLEERLKSRLGWGLPVIIDPPELETRAAVLLQKASSMGVSLPNDCAIYIAQRIRSNIRELEGALKRVVANAKFTNQQIDLALVKDALKDLFVISAKMVSIENIQKTVAEYYNIKLSDLLSKRRSRSITRPRQLAMALTKELTRHSLPEIGEAFNGRDHTTVLHACKKIAELRKESPSHEEDYRNLTRALTN